MRFVYIAGPYQGKTHDHEAYFEIGRHILAAQEAARQLARLGFGFFCPHSHSAHFEVIAPDLPASFWHAVDLKFLAVCDAVLLLPGWRDSRGARAEATYAAELGLPVFESVDDLVRHFTGGTEAVG